MERATTTRLTDLNVGRRTLLYGLAGGAGIAAAGWMGSIASVAHAAPGATAEVPAPPFDFDHGNALEQVLGPYVGPKILGHFNQSDATMVIRFAKMPEIAWYDAIAPYHPTAVGFHSRLGRRPASEGTTDRNRNIAVLYASYHVFSSLMPMYRSTWREMLQSVGLSPDDASEDTTTPVGIGNVAGRAVVRYFEHDGMNQLGDAGGRRYNRRPYDNHIGYKPLNTAYELKDAGRWQPQVNTSGNGIYTVQSMVTPQMSVVRPAALGDIRNWRMPAPAASNPKNRQAYRKQVDEIIQYSATLTDERKMRAEFFQLKFASLGAAVGQAAIQYKLNLEQWVLFHAVVETATYDATIACWYNKVLYDTVRPITAVHHVHGNRRITAWGGVGRGTVTDLPANEWRPYLPTPDHPEYPSGSTILCTAEGVAAALYLGTDEVQFRFPQPKGSSFVEPGITPAQDLTLSWENWTDWYVSCGESRIIGGVHFRAAVEESWKMGRDIGRRSYEHVMKYIDGTAA